ARAKAKAENGVDPADNSDNDSVDAPGGEDDDDGLDGAREFAETMGRVSTIEGLASVAALLIPPPFGETASVILDVAAVVNGAISAGVYLYTDGWGSSEFQHAAGAVMLSLLMGGVAGSIDRIGVKSTAATVAKVGHKLISPVVDLFDW
ncbi:hypothetical protein ACFV23_19250, partial [Streptomyces sp. NPDC059627]